MQPNFTKQIKLEGQTRERPLQKSMFLPEQYVHQQTPQTRSQPIQFLPYNPLKRSSTNILESIHQSNQMNSNPPFHQNNFSFSQNSYRADNPQPLGNEGRVPSQNQIIHSNSYNALKTLVSPPKNQYIAEQDNLRGFNKLQKTIDAKDTNSLIQQIIGQLKEKHLPQIITKAKKDLYDDIYNLRVELHSFREEFKQHVKKQEAFNAEVKAMGGSTINFNSNNINNINNINKAKEKDDFAELQAFYIMLETRVNQIETKMADNFQKVNSDIERMGLRLELNLKQKSWKVGGKSSLSPIMLDYKESFTIKKSKGEDVDQLVISSCKYFIDRYGYLMDAENCYLVDDRGIQIKLDDRHIKILESHKILHK